MNESARSEWSNIVKWAILENIVTLSLACGLSTAFLTRAVDEVALKARKVVGI